MVGARWEEGEEGVRSAGWEGDRWGEGEEFRMCPRGRKTNSVAAEMAGEVLRNQGGWHHSPKIPPLRTQGEGGAKWKWTFSQSRPELDSESD